MKKKIKSDLLGKISWSGDLNNTKEILVSDEIWFKNQHTGVEIYRRWRTEAFNRPRHLFRRLLAVTNFVLRSFGPRYFAKAIFDGVQEATRSIEKMIDVTKHLYVSI